MSKHIFFDLDRTLWDFEKNSKQALKIMFKEFDLASSQIDFPLFHKKYHGINQELWKKYGAGKITKKELRVGRFSTTLQKLNLPLGREQEMAQHYIDHSPYQTNLIPGTKETLTSLKKEGYQLHIITNGFKEVQGIKLKKSEILHFFDVIVCSEDAGKNKPHPEIFELALNKANAKAKDSCMIGDDYHVDYLGALRAGMKALYFNYQGEHKIRKQEESIDDLREIPGKLPWLFR